MSKEEKIYRHFTSLRDFILQQARIDESTTFDSEGYPLADDSEVVRYEKYLTKAQEDYDTFIEKTDEELIVIQRDELARKVASKIKYIEGARSDREQAEKMYALVNSWNFISNDHSSFKNALLKSVDEDIQRSQSLMDWVIESLPIAEYRKVHTAEKKEWIKSCEENFALAKKKHAEDQQWCRDLFDALPPETKPKAK